MIIHSNTKIAQLNNRIKEELPIVEETTSPVKEEIKTGKARRNKIKKEDFIEEEVIPSYKEEA